MMYLSLWISPSSTKILMDVIIYVLVCLSTSSAFSNSDFLSHRISFCSQSIFNQQYFSKIPISSIDSFPYIHSLECGLSYSGFLKKFLTRGFNPGKSYFLESKCSDDYFILNANQLNTDFNFTLTEKKKGVLVNQVVCHGNLNLVHVKTSSKINPRIKSNSFEYVFEYSERFDEKVYVWVARDYFSSFSSLRTSNNHLDIKKSLKIDSLNEKSKILNLNLKEDIVKCESIQFDSVVKFQDGIFFLDPLDLNDQKIVEETFFCETSRRQTLTLELKLFLPAYDLISSDFKKSLFNILIPKEGKKIPIHYFLNSYNKNTAKVFIDSRNNVSSQQNNVENDVIFISEDYLVINKTPPSILNVSLVLIQKGKFTKSTLKLIPTTSQEDVFDEIKRDFNISLRVSNVFLGNISTSLNYLFKDSSKLIFLKANRNDFFWNYFQLNPVNGQISLVEKIDCKFLKCLKFNEINLGIIAAKFILENFSQISRINAVISLQCPQVLEFKSNFPYNWAIISPYQENVGQYLLGDFSRIQSIHGYRKNEMSEIKSNLFKIDKNNRIHIHDPRDIEQFEFIKFNLARTFNEYGKEEVLEQSTLIIELSKSHQEEDVPKNELNIRRSKYAYNDNFKFHQFPGDTNEIRDENLYQIRHINQEKIIINKFNQTLHIYKKDKLKTRLIKDQKTFEMRIHEIASFIRLIGEIHEFISQFPLITAYSSGVKITGNQLHLGTAYPKLLYTHQNISVLLLGVKEEWTQEILINIFLIPSNKTQNCAPENGFLLPIFNYFNSYEDFKNFKLPILIGNLYKWSNSFTNIRLLTPKEEGLQIYFDSNNGNILLENDGLVKKYFLENSKISEFTYQPANRDISCQLFMIWMPKDVITERISIVIFENTLGSILYEFPDNFQITKNKYFITSRFYIHPNENRNDFEYPSEEMFAIDSTRNQLKLCSSCYLDREALVNGQITLQIVQVRDKSILHQTKDELRLYEITLVVKDMNDCPPTLVDDSYKITLFEDVSSANFEERSLLNLIVNDPDLYTGDSPLEMFSSYENRYKIEIDLDYSLNGTFDVDLEKYELVQRKPLDREAILNSSYPNVFLPWKTIKDNIDVYSELIIKVPLKVYDGSNSDPTTSLVTVELKNIKENHLSLQGRGEEPILDLDLNLDDSFGQDVTSKWIGQIFIKDAESVYEYVSSRIAFSIDAGSEAFDVHPEFGIISPNKRFNRVGNHSLLVRCSKRENPEIYLRVGVKVHVKQYDSSLKRNIFLEDRSLESLLDQEDLIHFSKEINNLNIQNLVHNSSVFYKIPIRGKDLNYNKLWFEDIGTFDKLYMLHPKTGDIYFNSDALTFKTVHIPARIRIWIENHKIDIFYKFKITSWMKPVEVVGFQPRENVKFDENFLTIESLNATQINGFVRTNTESSILPVKIHLKKPVPIGGFEIPVIPAEMSLDDFQRNLFPLAGDKVKIYIEQEENSNYDFIWAYENNFFQNINLDVHRDISLNLTGVYENSLFEVEKFKFQLKIPQNELNLPFECNLRYSEYEHDVSQYLQSEPKLQYQLNDEENCHLKRKVTFYLINGHEYFELDMKSGRLRQKEDVQHNMQILKAKARIIFLNSRTGKPMDAKQVVNYNIRVGNKPVFSCEQTIMYHVISSNEGENFNIGSILSQEHSHANYIYIGDKTPSYVSINPFNSSISILGRIPDDLVKESVEFNIRVMSEQEILATCPVKLIFEFCLMKIRHNLIQQNTMHITIGSNNLDEPIGISPVNFKCLNNARLDNIKISSTNPGLIIDKNSQLMYMKLDQDDHLVETNTVDVHFELIGSQRTFTLKILYKITNSLVSRKICHSLSPDECPGMPMNGQIPVDDKVILYQQPDKSLQLLWFKSEIFSDKFKCESFLMKAELKENIDGRHLIKNIAKFAKKDQLDNLLLENIPNTDNFLLALDDSGQLGVYSNGRLDRESISHYQISIKSESQSDICHVDLTILDENDSSPMFIKPLYEFQIPEDTLVNEYFDRKIEVFDMDDLEKFPIQLSIVGEVKGVYFNGSYVTFDKSLLPFKIDEATGNLKLISQLNYSHIKEYHANIRVYDQFGSHEAQLKVYVLNVNNNRPIWLVNPLYALDEEEMRVHHPSELQSNINADGDNNASIFNFIIDMTQFSYQSTITSIKAIDEDGGIISYGIEENECLQLNSQTGMISMKNAQCQSGRFSVKVYARDSQIQHDFINPEIVHEISAILNLEFLPQEQIIRDHLKRKISDIHSLVEEEPKFVGFSAINMNEIPNFFRLAPKAENVGIDKFQSIKYTSSNVMLVTQIPILLFDNEKLFLDDRIVTKTIIKGKNISLIDQSIINLECDAYLNQQRMIPRLLCTFPLNNTLSSRYKVETLYSHEYNVKVNSEKMSLELYSTTISSSIIPENKDDSLTLRVNEERCCFPTSIQAKTYRITVNFKRNPLKLEQTKVVTLAYNNSDGSIYYERSLGENDVILNIIGKKTKDKKENSDGIIGNNQIPLCTGGKSERYSSLLLLDLVKNGTFCYQNDKNFTNFHNRVYRSSDSNKPKKIIKLFLSSYVQSHSPMANLGKRQLNDINNRNLLGYDKKSNLLVSGETSSLFDPIEIILKDDGKLITVADKKFLGYSERGSCLDLNQENRILIKENCLNFHLTGEDVDLDRPYDVIYLLQNQVYQKSIQLRKVNQIQAVNNCSGYCFQENTLRCQMTLYHRPICHCRLGFYGNRCEKSPLFSLNAHKRSFISYRWFNANMNSIGITFSFILASNVLKIQNNFDVILEIDGLIKIKRSTTEDILYFFNEDHEIISFSKLIPLREYSISLTFSDGKDTLIAITNVEKGQKEYLKLSKSSKLRSELNLRFGDYENSFIGCITDIVWPSDSSFKEIKNFDILKGACVNPRAEHFAKLDNCQENWSTLVCQCNAGEIYNPILNKCQRKQSSFRLTGRESIRIRHHSLDKSTESNRLFGLRFKLNQRDLFIVEMRLKPYETLRIYVKNYQLFFMIATDQRNSTFTVQNLKIVSDLIYELNVDHFSFESQNVFLDSKKVKVLHHSSSLPELIQEKRKSNVFQPELHLGSQYSIEQTICFSDLSFLGNPIQPFSDISANSQSRFIYGQNYYVELLSVQKDNFLAGCKAYSCTARGVKVCPTGLLCQEVGVNLTKWGQYECIVEDLSLLKKLYMGLPFGISILLCLCLVILCFYSKTCLRTRKSTKFSKRKYDQNLLNGQVQMDLQKTLSVCMQNESNLEPNDPNNHLYKQYISHQTLLHDKHNNMQNFYPVNETISTSSDNNLNSSQEPEYSVVSENNLINQSSNLSALPSYQQPQMIPIPNLSPPYMQMLNQIQQNHLTMQYNCQQKLLQAQQHNQMLLVNNMNATLPINFYNNDCKTTARRKSTKGNLPQVPNPLYRSSHQQGYIVKPQDDIQLSSRLPQNTTYYEEEQSSLLYEHVQD